MQASNPTVQDLLDHSTWLRALAAGLVGNTEDVDDVVQDVWLATLKRPPQNRRNLKGWLATVTRNSIRQRRRQAVRSRDRELQVVGEAESTAPSSEELVLKVENQQRLASLVVQLEEPFREALLLRYYEGLTPKEIARQLGIPDGTVRWRLSKGLEHLRSKLDREHGGDRSTWMLWMVPLAQPDVPLTAAGLGSLKTLTGVSLMNVGMKSLVAAGLMAGVFFLTPLGSSLRDAFSAPQPVNAAVDIQPMEVADREGSEPQLQETTVVEQRQQVAVSESVAEHHHGDPSPAAKPTTGVRLQFLDENRNPVQGVEASIRLWGMETVRSDHSGSATVWVRPDVSEPARRVEYTHPKYLSGNLELNLVDGEVLDAGTITLKSSGSIRLLVRNSRGVPIEGAWAEPFSPSSLTSRSRFLEERRVNNAASAMRYQPEAGRSTAEGRIQLGDVHVGTNRFWVHAKGYLSSYTDRLDIPHGLYLEEFEVVLEDLDLGDLIQGQVLNPDGTPSQRASISTRRRNGSSSFHADESGRFVMAYKDKQPVTIRAVDYDKEFTAATARDVEGGANLTLRLNHARYMNLHLSSRGAPVDLKDIRVSVTDPENDVQVFQNTKYKAEGNVVRIALPLETFSLSVTADGHDRLELGPYPGHAAPERVEAVLDPLPGVHGVVMRAGEPASGVTVRLFSAAKRSRLINGYPTRMDSYPAASAKTMEDGTFSLTLRKAGTFYLRAETTGLAPAEIGPLHLDPGTGMSDLELQLTEGGVIEGEVFGAPQKIGHIVAISRGDGQAVTTRTDADGRFCFESLTPGDWLVELAEEEISPHSTSSSSNSKPFDESLIKTNCHVLEGKTTRHDLSLDPSSETLLQGRLELEGLDMSDWQAILKPVDDPVWGIGDSVTVALDAEGRFTLKANEPGSYHLTFQRDGGFFLLSETLELLIGENVWNRSFKPGALRIEGLEPSNSPLPNLFLVGQQGPTLMILAIISPEPTAEFTELPVMPCQVRRVDARNLSEPRDVLTAGELVQEVTLVANQAVQVRLN